MNQTITMKQIFRHPYFALICFLGLFLLLPQYGGMAVMFGCASLLTAYVAISPEQFRNRSGSMVTAYCLVAAMWVGAIFITVLTLMGVITG